MQVEARNEVQLRSARQLALHLRQNPEDAQRPPEDLAEQFGLPATFVADVLSGVQAPARRADSWLPKLDFSFIVRAYYSVDEFFERMIVNPVLFVLVTSGIVVLLGILTGGDIFQSRSDTAGLNVSSLLVLLLGVIVFGLHMIAFFKKRMVRFALLSGLGLWIGLSFLSMTAMWLNMKDEPRFQSTISGFLLLMSFVVLLVCSVYAAIGGGAAILGAYLEMLRIKLREDRMTRQELLEHYFAMQERLDASQGLEPKESIFDSVFAKAVINTGPLWALLTGLVLRSLDVLVTMAQRVQVNPTQQLSWTVFADLVLVMLTLIAYVMVGFFAKNFWFALIQSLAMTIGGIPPLIAGVQFFNLTRLEPNLRPEVLAGTAVGYLVISMFGALGGLVQRRAAKELNVAQNDPATILAEMVRIQWRLSERRSALCIMVVDAAKSAEMKSFADPLAVEYSFREYQHLLVDLSRQMRGRVHSTAGDGAVIAFESAQEAFTAAKRIQTDIERFNREDNRLQLPFRLRIGLHMGEIVGDLDEVEFTEVIDIAAHVQAAAPVGGIALTEEVANHLPIEEFIPLANPIDGHRVVLALNPTSDAAWQTYKT
jgi:class 3 adenylate cyclase